MAKKGNIKARDKAALCFLQDRNLFYENKSMRLHCNSTRKTVDHLATRCDRMLAFDYTRRHNKILRCIYLLKYSSYGLKSSKKIRNHSVQEIVCNEEVEIWLDNRIKTNVKIQCNKPDLFIYDRRRSKITLIEVGITSQDNLQTLETEKLIKYDLFVNELILIYNCKIGM
ncbi:hypothetical protein NUSPORA_01053 [Nucleospora cyclopteri]